VSIHVIKTWRVSECSTFFSRIREWNASQKQSPKRYSAMQYKNIYSFLLIFVVIYKLKWGGHRDGHWSPYLLGGHDHFSNATSGHSLDLPLLQLKTSCHSTNQTISSRGVSQGGVSRVYIFVIVSVLIWLLYESIEQVMFSKFQLFQWTVSADRLDLIAYFKISLVKCPPQNFRKCN